MSKRLTKGKVLLIVGIPTSLLLITYLFVSGNRDSFEEVEAFDSEFAVVGEAETYTGASSTQEQVIGGVAITAAARNKMANRVQYFIRTAKPTYEMSTANFSEDDVPIMLSLLQSQEYKKLWFKLTDTLPYLGRHDLIVPHYIQFVKRPATFELADEFALYAKTNALRWLGYCGGDEAEAVLHKTIGAQGAREFAQEWINQPLPINYDSESEVIYEMQYNSAKGLVYSQRPENVAFVERLHTDLFNEAQSLFTKEKRGVQLTYKEAETLAFFMNISETLAIRDLISRIGFEEFRPLISDRLQLWQMLGNEAYVKYGVQYN